MSCWMLDSDVAQLCTAIQTGDITDVQLLLHTGIDVNAADQNGETALHIATWLDMTDMVKELINSQACTDVLNQNGQSPLHLAASRGHVEIIRLLLKTGCSVNTKTKFTEMTALHLASQNGHTSIVELLLQQGAQWDATDVINKTAKFYAANADIADIFSTYRLSANLSKPTIKLQTQSQILLTESGLKDQSIPPTNRFNGQSTVTKERSAAQERKDPGIMKEDKTMPKRKVVNLTEIDQKSLLQAKNSVLKTLKNKLVNNNSKSSVRKPSDVPMVVNTPAAGPIAHKETSKPVAGQIAHKETKKTVAGPIANKETSKPVAGQIAHKETKKPVAGPIANKETSKPVAGQIAHKETKKPVAGPIANKESKKPATGQIAHKEIKKPVARQISNKETSKPVSDSVKTTVPRKSGPVEFSTDHQKMMQMNVFDRLTRGNTQLLIPRQGQNGK